jgi:hypothetical protein
MHEAGLAFREAAADRTGNEIHAIVEPMASGAGRFPAHLKLWLRAPRAGRKWKKVTVNDNPWSAFQDDAIVLPGAMLQGTIEIVAQY